MQETLTLHCITILFLRLEVSTLRTLGSNTIFDSLTDWLIDTDVLTISSSGSNQQVLTIHTIVKYKNSFGVFKHVVRN